MKSLKSKFAWGGAVSGGATGLSIGSNPALMAATGGWSPLIGAGIGAIAGTITEDKRIEEQRKLDEEAKRKLDAINLKQNNMRLSTYPTAGITGAEINYANGGRLKKGLVPISQDASKVVGPTHENGGVQLNSQEEVEKDEVLVGDKVFSKRLGFADKATAIINTPAYKHFENEKNKNEMVLNNLKSNLAGKNTAKRNIEKLGINPLDILFEEQEKFKEEKDLTNNVTRKYGGNLKKKYFEGGQLDNEIDPKTGLPYSSTRPIEYYNNNGLSYPKTFMPNSPINPKPNLVKLNNQTPEPFSFNQNPSPTNSVALKENKINTFGSNSEEMFTPINDNKSNNIKNLNFNNKYNISDFASLVDNVVNLALTKNTPKIPNQKLTTPRQLETKYNIAEPLNRMNTDYKNFVTNVDTTNTDLSVANSLKQQAFANKIKATNALYGDKINKEVGMKNQNTQFQSNTETQNNAIDYNNQFKQSMRMGDIQDRYSKNAMNLSEDLTQFKIDQKLEANDTATLNLYYKIYNKYGTLDRNFTDAELKSIGFKDEDIKRFRNK